MDTNTPDNDFGTVELIVDMLDDGITIQPKYYEVLPVTHPDFEKYYMDAANTLGGDPDNIDTLKKWTGNILNSKVWAEGRHAYYKTSAVDSRIVFYRLK